MEKQGPSQPKWRPDFPDGRISVHARIGNGVTFGPGTVVHDGVTLGDHSWVGEHCVVGHIPPGEAGPLVIGPRAILRSHTIVYANSRFGTGLETGHHVVIREKTIAGENLRVGNFSDIEGDCFIGDYCRLHGYVHVGKGTRIGHFVWLFSLCIATNDPLPPSAIAEPVTIEDGAVICVGVTLMPGTVVGKGAFLCAGTVARGKIPAGAVVSGPDGRVVSHVSQLVHLESGTRHPWMRHFRRGYPPEAWPRLEKLRDEIMETRRTLPLPSDYDTP